MSWCRIYIYTYIYDVVMSYIYIHIHIRCRDVVYIYIHIRCRDVVYIYTHTYTMSWCHIYIYTYVCDVVMSYIYIYIYIYIHIRCRDVVYIYIYAMVDPYKTHGPLRPRVGLCFWFPATSWQVLSAWKVDPVGQKLPYLMGKTRKTNGLNQPIEVEAVDIRECLTPWHPNSTFFVIVGALGWTPKMIKSWCKWFKWFCLICSRLLPVVFWQLHGITMNYPDLTHIQKSDDQRMDSHASLRLHLCWGFYRWVPEGG